MNQEKPTWQNVRMEFRRLIEEEFKRRMPSRYRWRLEFGDSQEVDAVLLVIELIGSRWEYRQQTMLPHVMYQEYAGKMEFSSGLDCLRPLVNGVIVRLLHRLFIQWKMQKGEL